MADWYDVPIGAGIAILLVREISRFLRERQTDDEYEGAGDKSVDFWDSKFREIVYTEMERHILPLLHELHDKLVEIDNIVRELRWRTRNERRDD